MARPYEVRLVPRCLCISNRITYGKWINKKVSLFFHLPRIYLTIGVTLWKIICTLLITNMVNVIVRWDECCKWSAAKGSSSIENIQYASARSICEEETQQAMLAGSFSKQECNAVVYSFLPNRVCHLVGQCSADSKAHTRIHSLLIGINLCP